MREFNMRAGRLGQAVVASSTVVLGGVLTAQDAVQWRGENGGNGHWYQLDGFTPLGLNWADAESIAVAKGGHLASITSAPENAFVLSHATAAAPNYGTFWIGGFRTDTSCTPACFSWTTGEPWGYQNWGPGGEPFDTWGCWAPNPNYCGWTGPGSGLAVEFITWGSYAGKWNDERPDLIGVGGAAGAPFVIEWSADCNADGIVDYGQIHAGELDDANANNIPDCCEQSTPCDPCPADIDDSGTVSAVDLAALLGVWNTDGGKYPRADIDGSGTVDAGDLAILLNSWGACP